MTDVVDPQDLLGRAEDAVRRLATLGPDCAEVFVTSGTSVNVDIERDVVTYTTTDAELGFGLRVIRDGRLGFSYTSDGARIEDAGRQALALTRLAPDTGYSVPPGGAPYSRIEGLEDPALLSMEPGEAVEMGGEMVDAVKTIHEGASVAGGGVSFGHGAVALANTEGVSISSRATSITIFGYVVLKDATVSTGFEFETSRTRSVDPIVVGEAASRMAIDAQGATPLEEGGEMTIVFRPTALADLLDNTVVPSCMGDAAQRGESAFTGRDGQQVAGKAIGIVDDPTIPGGLASGRSDDEGVPSRRNVLIEDGVLQGFLYDTFSGNQYGVETTASASRDGWKSQPNAGATNVVVDVPSKGELEDLIREVDRGLLIHDLMGAHTANQSTLDFSVNTTMPFEIRNGELLGVRNPAMLGGNVGALLEQVLGGGGKPRQCPSSANIIIPWIAAEGVTVTP